MVDCKGNGLRPNSAKVLLGDKYDLASGLMEITYDTGAKVILQGPTTYVVESNNGGFLSVGKLTASVEKKVASGQSPVASDEKNARGKAFAEGSLATSRQPLFTIKTPTAIVTDLGTEFGVEVDTHGGTTSHVFRGLVRVQVVADDDNVQGDGQLLHENQSARVEKRGDHPTVVVISSTKPAGFVRAIQKPKNKPAVKTLDLVDVVAGGNGFSGRRNHSIDPSSGQIHGELPRDPKTPKGDYTYHRVAGLPLVDGVFIPDGSRGPVQVDSAGHRFSGFDPTVNKSAGWILAIDVIPTVPPKMKTTAGSTRSGDAEYYPIGHQEIDLHANAGITFDLHAIRKANPGFTPARFRSLARNCEPKTNEGIYTYADIWVLVDGKRRFSRRQINSTHGMFTINVPLRENDRFLTLVATDGKDDISWDWIRFRDPRLELIPAASAASQEDRDL
jgi:hypothetical protein